MHELSSDPSFKFELLRLFAHAAYGGADIGECLVAAGEIAPGDFESWYAGWNRRAERLISQVNSITDPISVRDTMFRAATYLRGADFFLHGNWDDPRIQILWKKQAECFDLAISHLSVPGFRQLIPADGFRVSTIVFPASKDTTQKRPTILMCQPSVRRDQDLGFTHEWEKVVSPVIDYLETLSYVDMHKVGVLGYSMSGLLAARAAAFDSRISAVFSIDGLFDINETAMFDPEHGHFAKLGDIKDFDSAKALFDDPNLPTPLRWSLSHGLWAFKVQTPAELLGKISKFSLVGLADRIRCPVFIGDAANDMFFEGQPKAMAAAIGSNATLFSFTDEDGAGAHCNVGASRFVNCVMYDWFEKEVVRK
ncbi:2,6-dihydropseudooxynicotine hydrolase [Thozetella sp. PMI_491]|nr:2,6-dihydropseudooxynicotine hydrolase [Thozetella sp. PMI_491]